MSDPMIENPMSYFSQWVPERSALLESLEAEALTEQIPIVGPVMGNLLYLLARLHKPALILELGTATGYSTLFLARACEHFGGRVVSFEIDPDFIRRARANIADSGLTQHVEIREENALDAMGRMKTPVDMIFIDIEKEDYIRALPACLRLLKSGGLLFADNTGFKDADAFNRAIHSDGAWESVNIWSFLPGHSPGQDGLCIALKR